MTATAAVPPVLPRTRPATPTARGTAATSTAIARCTSTITAGVATPPLASSRSRIRSVSRTAGGPTGANFYRTSPKDVAKFGSIKLSYGPLHVAVRLILNHTPPPLNVSISHMPRLSHVVLQILPTGRVRETIHKHTVVRPFWRSTLFAGSFSRSSPPRKLNT
eukprot:GHVS01074460.1.p2 GENE.GHVS01074460.1~~GHVS01074460.1.p2  ORF type:complete len:163 (+),score=10.42 GHVS01074460.1:180-668(+)